MERATERKRVVKREGLRRQRPPPRSEAEVRRDYSRKPDPTSGGARHKKNTLQMEGVSDNLMSDYLPLARKSVTLSL